MRRLGWSIFLSLTALFFLTLAATDVASAQGVGPRIVGVGPSGPISYDPGSARLAGRAPVAGKQWEGLASTDYYNFQVPGGAISTVPNPQIAVGPDDVLTIVGTSIARYPNPNGVGPSVVPVNQAPTHKSWLGTWIGEQALITMCPGIQAGDFASCVIDNASVTYDQMQGRFVVLFTVTDTGIQNNVSPPIVTRDRRANWVLIISKHGTLMPDTNPNPPAGTTEIFTRPQPPGSQANPNSGGVTSTNWYIYYGSVTIPTLNQAADGLYNVRGQINDPRPTQTGAVGFDCTPAGVGNTAGNVCYFPVDARLGLDNDNIVISSGVYDDNIREYNPDGTWNRGWVNWAFRGTRVRVFKKYAVYYPTDIFASSYHPLVFGNPYAATPVVGSVYDLYHIAGTPGSIQPEVVTTNGLPQVGPGNVCPGGAAACISYTLDPTVLQPAPIVLPVPPEPQLAAVPGPLYEPMHLRGRALASFSGMASHQAVPGMPGNPRGGVHYLTGAVWAPPYAHEGAPVPAGSPGIQKWLYIRTITYDGNGIPYVAPLVPPGTLVPTPPPLQNVQTRSTFSNPDSPMQRAKLTQPSPNNPTPTPFLYVGDDRPHRVIFREGHLYLARVGRTQVGALSNFDGGQPYSTVIYNVIQKLSPRGTPLNILETEWQNGRYFTPMFDTPANVIQYGSVSPINLLPYLEKLFVGTTFPALRVTDPRFPGLLACRGDEPSVGTSSMAWPSLYDVRCGEDAYDTQMRVRHPITASTNQANFGTVESQNLLTPWGIRGGAATDPVFLGLWVYGPYAKGRMASPWGFGQIGTYVAYYDLSFACCGADLYGNPTNYYTDVQPSHPEFTWIQIARQTEIAPGGRTATTFNPSERVTRAEMAEWVIRAQMDTAALDFYLANTPGGLNPISFADVNTSTHPTRWKFIEAMYRRGYTKGCGMSDAFTNDARRLYCPNDFVTRGQMAVFLIRAKMNSVFPTVSSGSPLYGCLVTPQGDRFDLAYKSTPYFTDVPACDPSTFFPFIQKMRELRISVGYPDGRYGINDTLTRSQIAVFLVRAFFP